MDAAIHNSLETDAIRRRMQEVRYDLDEDVQEIVERTRDMGKWRTYVRCYPWVCLGTALAVGYWIVPRRSRETQPNAAMVSELANSSGFLAAPPPTSTARGILWSFVGNLVLRGVTSYVGQHAGKLFAPHAVKPQEDDQP